jgi:6,7-dimethyl-8-ribityllumazine synthase
MATYRGMLQASPEDRFCLVVSRFNAAVTELLRRGAEEALVRHGVDPEQIDVVYVPGAFEIPYAARRAVSAGYAAVICLGAVVRGETPHFDFVAGAATQGIAQLASSQSVPVVYGVLTCDTSDQARERAGGKGGNKGEEAACAALELVNLTRRWPPPPPPAS